MPLPRHMSTPWMPTANRNARDPAKFQKALHRIVFRRKLVQCVTVIQVVFLCDMSGRKKSSRQKKTVGSAAGSTSAHPKEELHAEMH